MARNSILGEFEQLVLLAALRLRAGTYAPEVARLLEERYLRGAVFISTAASSLDARVNERLIYLPLKATVNR